MSTENDFLFYNAGEEGLSADGKAADASDFHFVQQDAKIHDVKFTTKPTTFMKDAMNRFRKNKSSVVGGIILGILFLLALILPTDVLPYDITERHNYEANLPMKLNPAGSGFWDGTRDVDNQAYPYEVDEDGNDVLDDSGNKIVKSDSSYAIDPTIIVDTWNKKRAYLTYAAEDASGGFAVIDCDPSETTSYRYMYSYPYAYSLSTTDYTISYSLGTYEQDGYTTPKYALVIIANSQIYPLMDYTDDYGAAETVPDGATVTPHETITVSLNDLVDAQGSNIPSSVTSGTFSLGIALQSDTEKMTALYVQSYEVTGVLNTGEALSSRTARELANRSFGGDNSNVADANAMVLQEKTTSSGSNNTRYWTSISKSRFDAVDTFVIRCTIRVDVYKQTYGLRDDIPIDQSVLEKWKAAGYVDYDFTGATGTTDNPYNYTVSDSEEAQKNVYVTQLFTVKEQERTTDDAGNVTIIYAITGRVLTYKYLGYDSMPIHIFGTEYQGKDMLKYVFSGLRTSLLLGIIVAAINILIGVIWGSISGYYGGTVDIVMERFTDILGGIPWIVLMTVLVLKLGQTFFVFALALCLTGWIGTASTTRSQFYRYRDREYVLASKTLGAKPPRLIFRHILPNAIGTIITRSILMIPSVVFEEATISYLGLGFSNLDSLGVILSKNQQYLSTYPSQLVIPAVIISLLMICFNLFGNGLRDAFNPSLKGTD